MFKISHVASRSGLQEATGIMKQIYDENPKHWPNGLSADHFDGGLYLVRSASTNEPVGFCGWQERIESRPLSKDQAKQAGTSPCCDPKFNGIAKSLNVRMEKVGYYSIGVLKDHRRKGYAKAAIEKLIAEKRANVDRVVALVVESNKPSLNMASNLPGVETVVKSASARKLTIGQQLLLARLLG